MEVSAETLERLRSIGFKSNPRPEAEFVQTLGSGGCPLPLWPPEAEAKKNGYIIGRSMCRDGRADSRQWWRCFIDHAWPPAKASRALDRRPWLAPPRRKTASRGASGIP